MVKWIYIGVFYSKYIWLSTDIHTAWASIHAVHAHSSSKEHQHSPASLSLSRVSRQQTGEGNVWLIVPELASRISSVYTRPGMSNSCHHGVVTWHIATSPPFAKPDMGVTSAWCIWLAGHEFDSSVLGSCAYRRWQHSILHRLSSQTSQSYWMGGEDLAWTMVLQQDGWEVAEQWLGW